MKLILKKILKTVLVLMISTTIIYIAFTAIAFSDWCNKNQIFPFKKDYSDSILTLVDSDKIEELGDSVGNYAELLEQSLEEAKNNPDTDYESIAEYYDPLGFSVWSYMQLGINRVFTKYISISILLGLAITIAYIVITSKKLNNIFKFIIGYFVVMMIIPPMYMYSYTYRFWDIFITYSHTPIYFYIGYTVIFLLMYIINYKIGVKATKKLNQAIKNKE